MQIVFTSDKIKISIKIVPENAQPAAHGACTVVSRLPCQAAVPDQRCNTPPPSRGQLMPFAARSWRRLLTSRYHIMNINTTLVYVAYLQVSKSPAKPTRLPPPPSNQLLQSG